MIPIGICWNGVRYRTSAGLIWSFCMRAPTGFQMKQHLLLLCCTDKVRTSSQVPPYILLFSDNLFDLDDNTEENLSLLLFHHNILIYDHVFIEGLDLLNFANDRCSNCAERFCVGLVMTKTKKQGTWCGEIHPFSSIATASSFIIDKHTRSHAASLSVESRC